MDEIAKCRRGIDTARRRREEAADSWRDANEGLAGWCRRGQEAGLSIAEIARLAGMTRAAVYALIERGGSSAPGTAQRRG